MSVIETFLDGDTVELNRSPEAGNMYCKIKSANGDVRELCFEPGVHYSVRDDVDPELGMNKTTKEINTNFVNGFQTEPKAQFKLVEE
ncbi:MAG: hypothetical protein ABJI69_09255 [Balneola sp.]